MITIEEIIISSLYHRLVLVRIRRTNEVISEKTVNVDVKDLKSSAASSHVAECKTVNATTNKGLGYLYLGQSGNSMKNDKHLKSLEESEPAIIQSPGHISIDTISLETSPSRLREHNINLVDEEVFFKNQIGRIIEIGELHLMTRKSKATTEVQTDFEPIWCFNKDGGPIKSLESNDSLIDLGNCKEFSIVRLESLEQPEKRSLLVVNSSSDSKGDDGYNSMPKCETTDSSDINKLDEFNKTKIYNTTLAENNIAVGDRVLDNQGKNSNNLTDSLIDDNSLVGSYRIFNITNEGKAVLVNEEKSATSIHEHMKKEKSDNIELGGISDVLRPSSFVKFVVNRVEADSYVPESSINVSSNNQSSSTSPLPEVDFSELKFKTSQENCQKFKNPYSTSGGLFKERRRLSQKRSKSLRRHHSGMMVDGEKLLKHIMSCGGNEKISNGGGFYRRKSVKSSDQFVGGSDRPMRDVITITDFKISPMHPLRSLNSSQVDLRRDIDHEFLTPVHQANNSNNNAINNNQPNSSNKYYSSKLERKSRSERSSPLMMTATFITEDIDMGDNKNLEIDSNEDDKNTIFSDTIWNAKCEMPNSTSGSLPDDSSLVTAESSSTATSQSAIVEFEKFPDWMKKLPNKFKNLPLSKLCMPGSHICLAIDKDMRTSMEFSKCNYEMAEFLRKLPNLPVFNSFRSQMKHIWKAWMPKQCLSIYEQLQAGSRYLDMRITKHLGTLYGEHGLYTGQLKRYLKEVRLFLEEQPHEIVVIHLTPSYFVEAADKKHLVTMLFQVFGTKMACWNKPGHVNCNCSAVGGGDGCCTSSTKANFNSGDTKFDDFSVFPSINQLLRNGKQAIIIMPTEDVYNHVRNHIFGGSIWPDNHITISMPKKQSLDELRLFLDDCYSSGFIGNPENDKNNSLKVLRAVLSPDMSMVFGRYEKRRNMKELSFLDTSPLISEWLSVDGGKTKLNIVAMDFIGAPGLVKSVLDLNRDEKMATMMMMMMMVRLV